MPPLLDSDKRTSINKPTPDPNRWIEV